MTSTGHSYLNCGILKICAVMALQGEKIGLTFRNGIQRLSKSVEIDQGRQKSACM